jgi:hypothetical protein
MTEQLSKSFELAMELLSIQPMPNDIKSQLDDLRKNVPEKELELYDQLYDSLE